MSATVAHLRGSSSVSVAVMLCYTSDCVMSLQESQLLQLQLVVSSVIIYPVICSSLLLQVFGFCCITYLECWSVGVSSV